MRTKRATTRLVAAGALVAMIGVAACGDDGDDAAESEVTTAATEPASETTAPDAPETSAGPTPSAAPLPEIPGGTASAEFCEGFVGVEMAVKEVPEDPAAIEAFAAERITPNMELLEANSPEGAFGENVAVMTTAVGEVLSTGDFAAFETPEFSAASAAVYPAIEDACGIPDIDVTAIDFAYDGVPSTIDAGLTTFVMTNESESGEIHEMGVAKLKDGVDMPLTELLALPEEEVDAMIETFAGGVFAPPGAVNGTIANLTPGRWIFACFIPVGSVNGAEGTGMPHFMEGMAGEFTVA